MLIIDDDDDDRGDGDGGDRGDEGGPLLPVQVLRWPLMMKKNTIMEVMVAMMSGMYAIFFLVIQVFTMFVKKTLMWSSLFYVSKSI